LLAAVRREVTAVQAERLKRLDLTGEQVLRELARIGFSDIRLLFDEQDVLRPIHTLDEWG